jgi:hypothetical protein
MVIPQTASATSCLGSTWAGNTAYTNAAVTAIAMRTLEDVVAHAQSGAVHRTWGHRLALSSLVRSGLAANWQCSRFWDSRGPVRMGIRPPLPKSEQAAITNHEDIAVSKSSGCDTGTGQRLLLRLTVRSKRQIGLRGQLPTRGADVGFRRNLPSGQQPRKGSHVPTAEARHLGRKACRSSKPSSGKADQRRIDIALGVARPKRFGYVPTHAEATSLNSGHISALFRGPVGVSAGLPQGRSRPALLAASGINRVRTLLLLAVR